jgi:hypothetical protein
MTMPISKMIIALSDQATEALLCDLRGSPTDLAKLVKRIHQRRRTLVAISAKAITRWNKDDPNSWERVRGWLTEHDVRIRVD